MIYPWHLYLMGALYVIAGLLHFIKPNMYLRIMPSYLPAPKTLIYLSGFAEIILGVGVCIPATMVWASYGLAFMLIVFLLVHLYMLKVPAKKFGLPKWVLIARFFLQFLLIWWALYYI